jgi:hypothetical protein
MSEVKVECKKVYGDYSDFELYEAYMDVPEEQWYERESGLLTKFFKIMTRKVEEVVFIEDEEDNYHQAFKWDNELNCMICESIDGWGDNRFYSSVFLSKRDYKMIYENFKDSSFYRLGLNKHDSDNIKANKGLNDLCIDMVVDSSNMKTEEFVFKNAILNDKHDIFWEYIMFHWFLNRDKLIKHIDSRVNYFKNSLNI